MASHQNYWTEQLYYFAEHLYWEPQHINKKTPPGEGGPEKFKQTREKIRKQEVPLNILFNILIRLLPLRIKAEILNSFLSPQTVDFGQPIEYISIYDRLAGLYFIQPDMVLESTNSNICIEIKVDAHLSLNQVYKYLFLLGRWQAELEISRRPYLFLLTKKGLDAQWKSSERNLIFTQGDKILDLQRYLRLNDLPERLGDSSVIDLQPQARNIIEKVQLGWANWHKIGEVLNKEKMRLEQLPISDGKEILDNLIGDFLDELNRRKLWNS